MADTSDSLRRGMSLFLHVVIHGDHHLRSIKERKHPALRDC
jgi:hypothetical protein